MLKIVAGEILKEIEAWGKSNKRKENMGKDGEANELYNRIV